MSSSDLSIYAVCRKIGLYILILTCVPHHGEYTPVFFYELLNNILCVTDGFVHVSVYKYLKFAKAQLFG